MFFLWRIFIEWKKGKSAQFFETLSKWGKLPSESKPIKETFFDSDLQKYRTTFDEHRDYYNFYNSNECISEFLTVFENNFVLRRNFSFINFTCNLKFSKMFPKLVIGKTIWCVLFCRMEFIYQIAKLDYNHESFVAYDND